jgi:hypothetical protein
MQFDGWDVALLVAAVYIAVTALVRLMLRRRDQVLEELRRQVEHEQQHQDTATVDSRRKRSA